MSLPPIMFLSFLPGVSRHRISPWAMLCGWLLPGNNHALLSHSSRLWSSAKAQSSLSWNFLNFLRVCRSEHLPRRVRMTSKVAETNILLCHPSHWSLSFTQQFPKRESHELEGGIEIGPGPRNVNKTLSKSPPSSPRMSSGHAGRPRQSSTPTSHLAKGSISSPNPHPAPARASASTPPVLRVDDSDAV